VVLGGRFVGVIVGADQCGSTCQVPRSHVFSMYGHFESDCVVYICVRVMGLIKCS